MLSPDNLQDLQETEYFIFVNPIKNHYCTFPDGSLAAFQSEYLARQEEQKSSLLRDMIGYWATQSELEKIAQERTKGRWKIFV